MDVFEIVIQFAFDFGSILGEMSPYLLLGFLFAGILYAFMPQQKIEQYFNGNVWGASLRSSLLGIPLPLCSCGVIPTGMAFYKNGASKGGTVSFLISTPQTGVDSILATFSLMGLPFTIIRPIAALITGISGGIITTVITKDEPKNATAPQVEKKHQTLKQKAVSVFYYGFVEFIQDISKWLVIGLLLAAAISALIPDDFVSMLDLSPFVQMLLILVVSIPLYICATGSIPLAAILILKGISPGAAFVLLMAGPATNAATITMIGKVMGKKSLFAYLGSIIVGALGTGLFIDYVLPVHWFTAIAESSHVHSHEGLAWWEIASAAILTLLIINGYIQKYIQSKTPKQDNIKYTIMNTQVIKVDGMDCNHCKRNVETNLEKLECINKASVTLADKTVTLEGDDIDEEKVKETIEALGYKCL